MKSSRLSLFVAFFCAFLPFGVWGQTTQPAALQPAKSAEQIAEDNFGACSVEAAEACYQVSVNGVSDPTTVKAEDKGCVRGYRYDEVKKKLVWFETSSPKCKEVFKKIDKQKADKKKKQQASSQPTSKPSNPATNPVVPTKDTFTIEVTRAEWEALLAKVNGLTPGDPNYTTIIAEIRNRLSLNDGNIIKEGTSREKEIRDLQTVVNSIDGQIKGLQILIDDEAAARKKADEEIKDRLTLLERAILAMAVDQNTQQGHKVFMEYLVVGSLVNNEWPTMDHFMGMGLRLGVINRVGLHGSVGVDLNMINRVPNENGGNNIQFGLTYPDLTWAAGVDVKRNEKFTLTTDIRGVHRSLMAVGGITVSDLEVFGCGGAEASVFKGRHNSALTMSLCAGIQSDADPSNAFSMHIGFKHGLWTKEK